MRKSHPGQSLCSQNSKSLFLYDALQNEERHPTAEKESLDLRKEILKVCIFLNGGEMGFMKVYYDYDQKQIS
jgi:hypothetical protein